MRDLDLQRGQDALPDLLAHAVDVVERAVEAFGPDDAGVARVDQLDGDREARAADLDRARQAVTHAEQAADLAHVRVRGAQAKRGARAPSRTASAGARGR